MDRLVYCVRSLLLLPATGWPRSIVFLICIGHFTQKSPMMSGSFAERDLQLKASYTFWPPCSKSERMQCKKQKRVECKREWQESAHAVQKALTQGTHIRTHTRHFTLAATHCNTLQHTATHEALYARCNTLQHTATHCNTRDTLRSPLHCMGETLKE